MKLNVSIISDFVTSRLPFDKFKLFVFNKSSDKTS